MDIKDHGYPIYIERGILDSVNDMIKTIYQGKKIMIISDDNVFSYYGQRLIDNLKDYQVGKIVIKHGEQSKNFKILPEIYEQLLDFKLTRTDLIIALGGGVIGDLAGFVAATYLRGVRLVQIPTSLLAQVDSSVGGKVAVDLDQGKNLVGVFYHPKMVLIDPNTLETLEQRFINDGMGEVIKYGCIKDKNLFEQLASHSSFVDLKENIDQIIYTCVDIKRSLVEADLYDFGDRLVLNFGHTLGHALEQYFNYAKYSHGEAVAIGMVQLTKLSEEKGLSPRGTATRIADLCQKYGLPVKADVETKKLIGAVNLDKKNINSSLNLILLQEIGQSYIYKTNNQFLLDKERI